MLVYQVLAAMPEQESVEEVIGRLNERMMDKARDNFDHMLIDPCDFVGYFHHKETLLSYYRKQGFSVKDLDDSLLVSWKL